MSRTVFNYIDGYLRVEFAPIYRDDIAIIFHLHGDGIVRTPVTEKFEKGTPDIAFAEDLIVRTWTSPSVSAFFLSMVRWLEAVICEVQECAFRWEGEGPDGELRWRNNWGASGHLQLQWSGSRDTEPVDCGILLNRAQMVRALYSTFRDFVESDRYDPLVYEELRAGEVFALVLEDSDLEVLADTLADRNRLAAGRLLDAMLNRAWDYKVGYPRKLHLAEYVAQADALAGHKQDEEQVQGWLLPEWDGWSRDRRRTDVMEAVYPCGVAMGLGERLRELRSPVIEAWLEKHATAEAGGASNQGRDMT